MTTAKKYRAQPTVLAEPIVIEIEGSRVSDPETDWSESFRSRLAASGEVLDLLAGAVQVDRGQVVGIHQAQAIPILRRLLHPGDLARFEALLQDQDRVVDLGTLWQIARDLVQELTDRPTGGSGTSSAGPDPERV